MGIYIHSALQGSAFHGAIVDHKLLGSTVRRVASEVVIGSEERLAIGNGIPDHLFAVLTRDVFFSVEDAFKACWSPEWCDEN